MISFRELELSKNILNHEMQTENYIRHSKRVKERKTGGNKTKIICKNVRKGLGNER